MYKLSAYLLLPLMLINLTVAENRWVVFGLRPDQIIYAITIVLALYVSFTSRYWRLAALALVPAVLIRFLNMSGIGESLHEVELVSLAVIFTIVGASVYGRNPSLLHKQLVVYLAICIPIMLLQILGASSFLMGWNIGYLHDPNLMVLSDVGSFKEMPLYPTLFIGFEDLVFTTGQARPVGLMYASNPLSIFISIALAINLARTRSSRIGFSDIVVTLAAVLSMCKLVFGVAIALYMAFLFVGSLGKRRLALKLMAVLAIFMLLYFVLFPGLFETNLSVSMIMVAVMLRLVDFLKALGIDAYFDTIRELAYIYRPDNRFIEHVGYSGIANFLRLDWFFPASAFAVVISLLYIQRIRLMNQPTAVYVITLLTCVLTQFAVPFVGTPSFQLVIGFALFPLFRKMWHSGRKRLAH